MVFVWENCLIGPLAWKERAGRNDLEDSIWDGSLGPLACLSKDVVILVDMYVAHTCSLLITHSLLSNKGRLILLTSYTC